MVNLVKGSAAPDFTLPADSGQSFTLSAQRGQPVVLFFYPEDDTPSCTNENLEFSALADAFAAAGVTLVGISPDPVKAHAAFRAKFGLNHLLLSDPDRQVIEAYGLWQEKSMYGRTYMGLVRTSVLIDAKGDVAEVWKVTRVKGHAQKVLEAAQALTRH